MNKRQRKKIRSKEQRLLESWKEFLELLFKDKQFINSIKKSKDES